MRTRKKKHSTAQYSTTTPLLLTQTGKNATNRKILRNLQTRTFFYLFFNNYFSNIFIETNKMGKKTTTKLYR